MKNKLELTYEPLSFVHLSEIAKLWADEEVIKYTNIKSPCSMEESRKRMEVFLDNQKDLEVPTIFAVIKEGEVCGVAGCPVIDKDTGEFGFFYQISRSEWKKGIGGESAGWILDYMNENFSPLTLYADAIEKNVASIKILERLRFEQTGKQQCQIESQGSETVETVLSYRLNFIEK